NQEIFMIDKNTVNRQSFPFWLKCWFFFNFLNFRTTRAAAKRVEILANASGFACCVVGIVTQAVLAGGLCVCSTAYLFYLLIWQGDKYGIWYERLETKST